MAQFDVHRNLARNRGVFPFLSVVQSQRWSRAATRLVIPLNMPVRHPPIDSALTPLLTIEGETLMLNPLMMFTIETVRLGPVVITLADDTNASRIIAAIDEAISRGYR